MILRWQRLRLWWENAFWVIPLIGIVLAFALSSTLEQLDEAVAGAGLEVLAPASALTLLAAIGGGMVTFTGFVFSVVLLVIQFGSAAYSPRTVTYFLRARATQWVLASFLGTITFSFLSLFVIGSGGRSSYVPLLSVVAAIGGLVINLVGFLVLISVMARRIKVDSLLTAIGRTSRHQLRLRYAAAAGRGASSIGRPIAPLEDAPLVRYAGRPGQVVGIDVGRLARLVRRHEARVQLLVRIGDGVSVASPIAFSESGPLPTAVERSLGRCLLVQAERSLKYDPLYALRLLIDVALRALSPGVHDPTTAVRALDEVEGVLRVAAPLPLGAVRIRSGSGSVVVRGATWSDVVDLALLEVIEAGLSEPQVTRRVSALLTDLLADVPDDQEEPLLRYQRRLVDHVAHAHPLDQDVWLTGDRQGIGGSR